MCVPMLDENARGAKPGAKEMRTQAVVQRLGASKNLL